MNYMLHDTRNPVCARMPHADVMSHESASYAHAGSTGGCSTGDAEAETCVENVGAGMVLPEWR